MSNRTDFDELARELVEMFHLDPGLEYPNTMRLQERLERELHNAYVAGEEGSPIHGERAHGRVVVAAPDAERTAELRPSIFIVVYKDRHTDDRISVHCSREGADRRVDAFKAQYQEAGYQWTEEPEFRWERNAFTDDDGPSVRIRSAEVEE
jgi:hypothetical protein